jgi:sugar lactone lactonase YvrE
MNRRRAAALVATLTLAALLPVAPAGAEAPGGLRDRINLPRGWEPEGVTTDGRLLWVGSLADGAIRRIDPQTAQRRTIHQGKDGRMAVGLDFDRRRHMVWVAGGESPVVRVHDAVTGDVVRTYRFRALAGGFLNDLVVTREGVFATDSAHRRLAMVPLRGAGLPPRSAARTLRLTGAFDLVSGFNLNGIAATKGTLLSVQSNTGKLFRINPDTGRTRAVRLGGYSLANGDGLELRGDTLYVVRNQDERIAVLDLAPRLRRARLVDEITSSGFDVPTTVAQVGRSLWVVNARFGTAEPEKARYWLTRVPAYLPSPPR